MPDRLKFRFAPKICFETSITYCPSVCRQEGFPPISVRAHNVFCCVEQRIVVLDVFGSALEIDCASTISAIVREGDQGDFTCSGISRTDIITPRAFKTATLTVPGS
jgi:hypothetical protein